MDHFLAFYDQLYGHDRPEEWFDSLMTAFLYRGSRSLGGNVAQLRVPHVTDA